MFYFAVFSLSLCVIFPFLFICVHKNKFGSIYDKVWELFFGLILMQLPESFLQQLFKIQHQPFSLCLIKLIQVFLVDARPIFLFSLLGSILMIHYRQVLCIRVNESLQNQGIFLFGVE
jgi:hypothetical protein